MIDSHGRQINYLRISVTDRCNLRCTYCMPEDGIEQIQCADILSYEDFLNIVNVATRLGIKKVRITGGEPLVRKGIMGFLAELTAVEGIEEVTLTTNGILLSRYARELKEIGIKRLNISIDSLIPEVYTQITRRGRLSDVLDGIAAADNAGLKIKLNIVAMRGINDNEIKDLAAMSLHNPWSVRFIEYMPTNRDDKNWRNLLIPGKEILARVEEKYQLKPISTGNYCGPAKPYQIEGARGTIGIITPMSEHFCSTCNRIRVTANGLVKSCLFSERAYDLKPYLQSEDNLYEVLHDVIKNKPPRHHMNSENTMPAPFSMARIGG
jgi:cyclic pyranopterin phosphate synthase